MARFRADGLDDIIQQMKDLGDLTGETADQMLLAGAEKMVSQWKWEIRQRKHIMSGDMINSIVHDKRAIKLSGNFKEISIFARGKSKGVANATKVFMTHYGTSKTPGTHWVDEAEKHAVDKVTRAMSDVWDEALKKKGII